MELDYIDNVNAFGESIIRLYNFDKEQSIQFTTVLLEWLGSAEPKLNIGGLEFIEPRNCNLILCKSEENDGILTKDGNVFYCLLNQEGYKDMLEVLRPFCLKNTKGYSFLYDIDNPIDFLFSPAGTW